MPDRKFGGEENCADSGIDEGFLNRYCGGGGADRTSDLPRFLLALIFFRAPTNMIICKCVINGETVNPNASCPGRFFILTTLNSSSRSLSKLFHVECCFCFHASVDMGHMEVKWPTTQQTYC